MNDPILHPTAERLQAFAENALGDGDRAVVESHLVSCTTCQADLEEWRSLFTLLSTLPQHSPSPHFADLVMKRVKLPDPWYVKAAARIGAQLQVFTPQTTRGWALATACMSLPVMLFGALTAWLLSKPYITPQGLVAFAADRLNNMISGSASATYAGVMQSDVALYFARALETLAKAGPGAAGAALMLIAFSIALSAWFLYQNLFRTATKRENDDYVSYSF